MNTFDFNRNAISRRVRTAPSRYADSRLRGSIEINEGDHPPAYFQPHPCLPVRFQDVTTQRFVVIPAGRICSMQGTHNPYLNTTVSADDNTDIIGPHGTTTGVKPGFVDTNGTVQTHTVATSKYGYGPDVLGLMVPANGGQLDVHGTGAALGKDTQTPYRTIDVGVTWHPGLAAKITATNVTGSLVHRIPANYPIGVAHSDIYSDDRGEYLNDQMFQSPVGVVSDWYISIPCIACQATANQYDGSTYTIGFNNFVHNTGTEVNYADDGVIHATNDVGYYTVMDYFSFLYFDRTAQADHSMIAPGIPLVPDSFGNWISSGYISAATGDGDHATHLATDMPVQACGRLMGLDYKHPKASLETVSTFYGSENPGTETRGIDWVTYYFAKLAMESMGVTTTAATIFDAIVTDRVIGTANIQLINM